MQASKHSTKRNNLSIAFGALVACIIGCTPPKTRVFVDARQLTSSEPNFVSIVGSPFQTSEQKWSAELGGMVPGSLSFSRSKASVTDYLAELKKREATAISNYIKLTQDRLTQAVEAQYLDSDALLAKQRRKLTEEALAELREVFEKYADKIGAKRVELANYIGTPDPKNNRPVYKRPWLRKTPQDVQKIRDEIGALESSYLRDRSAVLSQIESTLTINRAVIESRRNAELIAAKERATNEGEKLYSGSRRPINVEQNVNWGITFPSLSPLRATSERLDLPKITLPIIRMQPIGFRAHAMLKSEIAAWAADKGYEIVSKPTGVEDKTIEFREWRKQFRAGL